MFQRNNPVEQSIQSDSKKLSKFVFAQPIVEFIEEINMR